GGTQIQVSYAQTADLADIRNNLEKAGFPEVTVINYGTSKDVLITLVPKQMNAALSNEAQAEVIKEVMAALPTATVGQASYIGPQVGKEMTSKSVMAVLFALLGTMVYIAFRFDIRFSIGSTI